MEEEEQKKEEIRINTIWDQISSAKQPVSNDTRCENTIKARGQKRKATISTENNQIQQIAKLRKLNEEEAES